MKKLTVTISDNEFSRFGFQSDVLNFEELVRFVKTELAKDALDKSIKLAKKYGLDKLSMEDINQEIKAVRDAKRHS